MSDSQSAANHIAANNHRDTRIILWDIDGTLMTSAQAGAYKNYFAPALEKVFGTSGDLDGITVSGMTDFQIAFEALEKEGFTVEQIRAKLPVMLEVFPSEMRRILGDTESHILLKGVKELLDATKADKRYINGLLTGNLTPAAQIKLEKVGLADEFDFEVSAFGEISNSRNDLPLEAIKKAQQKFDYEFAPSQFIIVGDTPNDILCARHCGVKVISVATGRGQTMENLAKFEPDYLFADLSDTQKVLEALKTL
jgi:phosphoglycolate phosphatase